MDETRRPSRKQGNKNSRAKRAAKGKSARKGFSSPNQSAPDKNVAKPDPNYVRGFKFKEPRSDAVSGIFESITVQKSISSSTTLKVNMDNIFTSGSLNKTNDNIRDTNVALSPGAAEPLLSTLLASPSSSFDTRESWHSSCQRGTSGQDQCQDGATMHLLSEMGKSQERLMSKMAGELKYLCEEHFTDLGVERRRIAEPMASWPIVPSCCRP